MGDGPARFECESAKFEGTDIHATLDELSLIGLKCRHPFSMVMMATVCGSHCSSASS
jgi:hypothetical protein